MLERKKTFKRDLFEETEEEVKKQTLFDIEINDSFLLSHFEEKQIKKLKLLDQEYRLQSEELQGIRRKLNAHNRRIQLACTVKLYAQATQIDQNIQDEIVEIGEKCPILLSYFKDNNTFYRSFIIQYLFRLVFNDKDEKECKKNIFKFIKKVQQLEKFDCQYPVEFIRFKENDLKCYLLSFILRTYLFKLLDKVNNLEKIIKQYNDQPEVDTAAIVICKNLLSIRFSKLLTHETYKFLIDDNQERVTPQMLAQYDEVVNPTIIALFVEVFQCNMIIMNDERAEQPEYFIPQTKKAITDDIYIYRSSENFYFSIFEKVYAEKYLSFCINEGYLYQQDQKELADKLKITNEKLNDDAEIANDTGAKEQKRWIERVNEMEQNNKDMKAKQEDYFPLLKCCECERELSDNVPLLKFDVYYFCEACVLDMINQLNREDKQFIYIGKTQVKRYQLRDAITELNNEREKQNQLRMQQKNKKKDKSTLGYKESQDLLQKHNTSNPSDKSERKWQDLQKVCVRCNDTQCYQEELYLLKEVKTLREVAVCISCLVFLYDQVRYTYRNVQLHKSFELSNEEIKNTYKDFSMNHLEKTKQTCLKCNKIRLNNYIIQPQTKALELKIICKQCFIDIFQHDEKLNTFQITDLLKEQILDQFFIQDYKNNICISCNKPGLKTFVIENASNYSTTDKSKSQSQLENKKNPDSANQLRKQHEKEQQKLSKLKLKLSDSDNEKENEASDKDEEKNDEEDDDEEEPSKRLSRICVDCIFLNIGKCKNPFMDYLITYAKLRTNIVYKYNQQIKMLLENDARRKMQQLLNTCTMCLRKLKDLHQMNDKDQRICNSCFVQYRKEFKANQGMYDGYECDFKHQELIFNEILAHLVDITQCVGCKEKIKNFEYEVIKVQNSYSNVVLCDNCIKEQLVQVKQDLRQPYEIKSQYFNENLTLQNKKEVNQKIQQFVSQMKAGNINIEGEDEGGEQDSPGTDKDGSQRVLKGRRVNTGIPPKQRQHLTNKHYQLRCFNRTCKQVELSQKTKTELRFVKMPKCQCIFCVHCFTSFYYKLAEVRIKKQIVQEKQSSIRDKLEQAAGDNKKNKKQHDENEIEDEKYCPSMLCNSKYTENQIKELANGYQIQLDEEEEESELEKKQKKLLEEETRKKYIHNRIPCSVCNKENRLLVVMNDDYFINLRREQEKQQIDFKKMNNYYLMEKEDEFLKEVVGNCECVYSCKPCIFQIYYKDRCNRCLKKPSPHIYKLLFNFKENMKCSQCQNNKFIPLEDGPLIYRTDTKYQCVNCQMKFEMN